MLLPLSPSHARYKLVFCAVPKNACTEWIRMMYRMTGDSQWQLDPHFRGGKPLFNKLPPENATALINDPAITKAVFFRDPASRLLSAYLDKFVYRGSYSMRLYNRKRMTFSEFVAEVAHRNMIHGNQSGLHMKTNPHWRPQRFLCNLDKFLPLYNFVGSYENVRDHSEVRGGGGRVSVIGSQV